MRWTVKWVPQPPHGPKSLEEWKRFWGAAETGSLEGTLRFQGGSLLSRPEASKFVIIGGATVRFL